MDPPEDPPNPPEDPPSGQAPLTTSEIAILTSHEDPMLDQPGAKYRYIIIRDNLHAEVDEIRASHPEAEILVYKDVSFTVKERAAPMTPTRAAASPTATPTRTRTGTCTGLQRQPHHLLGLSRPRGDEHRQLRLPAGVARKRPRAPQDGDYDGVFMDDTNLFPGHGMDGQISELSDNAYRNATVDFVDTVSPALQAPGLQDDGEPRDEPLGDRRALGDAGRRRRRLGDQPRGLHPLGRGGTTFTDESGPAPFWRWELELMEDIQDRGAGYHAITYGTANDVQGQRYMRATFLLGWNGEDGSSNAYRVTSTAPPFMPDWTTDVGTPTGSALPGRPGLAPRLRRRHRRHQRQGLRVADLQPRRLLQAARRQLHQPGDARRHQGTGPAGVLSRRPALPTAGAAPATGAELPAISRTSSTPAKRWS